MRSGRRGTAPSTDGPRLGSVAALRSATRPGVPQKPSSMETCTLQLNSLVSLLAFYAAIGLLVYLGVECALFVAEGDPYAVRPWTW